MFVSEFLNNTSSASNLSDSLNNFLPSSKLMGCNPGNNEMKDYIKFLEQQNSTDFVAESDFLGKTNNWLNRAVIDDKINNINGFYIGTKKSSGSPVLVDDLLGSSFLDLHSDAIGLYIPWDELIMKTALQWFTKMSPEQVLKSNTVIGKHLLVNS